MDKLMPYLIAVVATWAAVQSWKKAHAGEAPKIGGPLHAPCGSCATNPHGSTGCCGH